MKKIILSISAALLCLAAFAQDQSDVRGKVQMAVFIPDQAESIPAGAQRNLKTRINSMLAKNGMAGTENFTQFFLTCDALVVEKNVIPGAPTKYQQKIELNIYAIDAFGGKCYGSVQIPSHAVANSDEKAYIACFNSLPTATAEIKDFFQKANANIIAYYDSQADNIIARAYSLAQGKDYEQALFQLALVPEACKSYQKVHDAAIEIYKQYVDMQSFEYLAKARSIWNAGQDAAAAAEAGEYIAKINPNASCYPDAVKLSDEIKARVKSDIDYYRKQDELDRTREHQQTMAQIEAWKSVGVAYGNNQKANTYYNAFAIR